MTAFTQQHYLIVSIITLIFIGCGERKDSSSATSSSDLNSPTNTTQCKKISPIPNRLPKVYFSSKDEYDKTVYKSSKGSFDDKGSDDDKGSFDENKGSHDTNSHNEGKACLNCHSFISAGTVFRNLNAPNHTPGAVGYHIQLNDTVVYTDANYGAGNQIANTFPTKKYTAHVIDANGNIVNSSAFMSHDMSRRNCNSCHTETGNNGAPGRITTMRVAIPTAVPTTPAATLCISFNSNVMPILETRCKSCHGTNGDFTVTTTNATYAKITTLQTNGAQYMLDKGTNAQMHAGGQIIAPNSVEYTTIKTWITEGAINN